MDLRLGIKLLISQVRGKASERKIKRPRVVFTTREAKDKGAKAQRSFKRQRLPSTKLRFGAGAHLDEPQPTIIPIAASPAEVRETIREDVREAGVGIRIHPRGIGNTTRVLAVWLKHLIDGFPPLPLWNPPMLCTFRAHGIEVWLVADGHPFEAAGLRFPNLLASELPVLGIVAGPPHHIERLVLRRFTVERQLEDFAAAGYSMSCHGCSSFFC